MTDGGYTLAETLGALAVLGMALGGLTTSLYTLGGIQHSASVALADAGRARSIEQHVTRLVEPYGPYLATENPPLTGDNAGFRFACGQPAECEVKLTGEPQLELSVVESGRTTTFRLEGESAKFVYQGRQDLADIWPGEPRNDALRSISLIQTVENEPRPALQLRLRSEQPTDCRFFSISQACL